MSDDLDDTDGHDTWLSPAQAAAALGVSERTIHRRLAVQRYAVRHVDGRTLVRLPAAPEAEGFTREAAGLADTADVVSDTSDDLPERQTRPTDTSDDLADTVRQAVRMLEHLLEQEHQRTKEERARVDQERERASAAEQAAAMWQERARNLEAQVEQLLALPAHEEQEEPARHWWQVWRH